MSTMSAAQAITNAVEAELASARFYSLLADSTSDPGGKAFLEEMADLERTHAMDIKAMGEKLAEGPLAEKASMDVSMVETLPDWKYADDVTLPEAFEIAIAAEQQASLYYDALADFLDEPVRGFFLDLAEQEEAHRVALEEKRTELGLA